ncbi:MAG: flagellar basal body rod protein FlgC [Deltaproteobacteria bacterium]
MEFFTTFKICAAGLSAQRAKLDVITSNIANVNTTSTPEGGPYKRKTTTFFAEPLKEGFDKSLADAVRIVKVQNVIDESGGFKRIYDPAHPDADKDGVVTLPNVNIMLEMTDLITASRSYEACATAFDAAKNMALKAMDIGK